MLRQLVFCLFVSALCASCGAASSGPPWENYRPPDWRRYQARNVTSPYGPVTRSSAYAPRREDRFSFRDLKTETDESLAGRLLGQIGSRISYIDRHRERWHLYEDDEDGAESVDLYTRPYALGSQFGLCGIEKYSVEFDNEGRVESVTVNQHYGVEGPIFQKADFDWDHYSNIMCASVPATHAPSYFPATDALMADDAAALLIVLFDRAASPGTIPFSLPCRTWDEGACSQDVRAYLGDLRLEDIDELSLVNCPLRNVPQHSVCFTIITDQHRVGPYPKYITVRGSTYMNDVRLDSVEILEGSTMS